MKAVEDRVNRDEMEEANRRRVADLMNDVVDRGARGLEKTGDVLVRLPYVLIGSTALGLQGARDALRAAARIPGSVARATVRGPGCLAASVRRTPRNLAQGFEEREEEGRRVIDRVFGRSAVSSARARIRNTEASVKGARTSAARAARASGAAAKAAVEAVVDPRDTRPYDERTREELYELASQRDLAGRAGMKKAQLIKALRAAR